MILLLPSKINATLIFKHREYKIDELLILGCINYVTYQCFVDGYQ